MRKEGKSHGWVYQAQFTVLYDFLHGKVKKNILSENFTNCYVILLIHFMKIIWTGGEKIPEIFAQLFDSSERRLSCMP